MGEIGIERDIARSRHEGGEHARHRLRTGQSDQSDFVTGLCAGIEELRGYALRAFDQLPVCHATAVRSFYRCSLRVLSCHLGNYIKYALLPPLILFSLHIPIVLLEKFDFERSTHADFVNGLTVVLDTAFEEGVEIVEESLHVGIVIQSGCILNLEVHAVLRSLNGFKLNIGGGGYVVRFDVFNNKVAGSVSGNRAVNLVVDGDLAHGHVAARLLDIHYIDYGIKGNTAVSHGV